MIAETGARRVGNSSISLHRLGTFGKLRGTVPVLSLTAMIRSMCTFVDDPPVRSTK